MSAKINFSIDQGSVLDQVVYRVKTTTGSYVDLTGKQAICTLRSHYAASNSFVLGVALTANGEITIQANSAVTNEIGAGRYVYDVTETVYASNVAVGISKMLEGYVLVNPRVS